MDTERVVCSCDHHDDRHAFVAGAWTGACTLCRCPGFTPRRAPSAHVRADGQPKTRYPTRSEAKAASKRIREHDGMHTYECGSCGGWHLSSSPRRAGE